jgi:STE24 endopeptidase
VGGGSAVTLRQAHLGTRRRERVLPWALAAATLAVVGLVGSLRRPFAPDLPASAPELDGFDAAVLVAVEAYRGPRYVVGITATLVALAVPLLVVTTHRGRRWVRGWAGGANHAPLRAARVALWIVILTSLATLPLAAWTRIVHDGRWGFRTQPVSGWVRDWLLVSAGSWVLTAVLAAVLFAAIRRWPRSWPFRLTVLGTALAAAFVLLHPLVIQPLLLPTSPLPPGEARDAIEEVLVRAGEPDVPLLVGEASRRTTRVNAAVVGLGPTERVVIHDTLLELPVEQVASVVAHELAHRQHADLVRGVLLGATGLLVALLVLRGLLALGIGRRLEPRGPTDPRLAAVVVAVVAVFELVGSPVANLVSRHVELAADARALELTGDPEPLLRTTRTFTVRDLAAPEPPRALHLYYGTHPSVGQRIRYVASWAQVHGVTLPTRAELEEAEASAAHDAVVGGAPDR